MIKILSNEQIRKADQYTISHEPVSSIDLMERAATACTQYLLNTLPAGIKITIVCGQGNNGGDGLAIARQLWKKGRDITVWITENTGTTSGDFTINLNRLREETTITVQTGIPSFSTDHPSVIIDAIFGSGLNRIPQGTAAETIQAINKSGLRVISIDIPSGLYADQHTPHSEQIIRAVTTLVFQAPRPCFLYAEYEPYIGEFEILDIQLSQQFINEAPAYGFIPDEASIRALLPYRPLFGHKGTFGHALLLAGSTGKTGAAILAAGAALRSGTAMVTVRAPQCSIIPLQTAAPEAMCYPDPGADALEEPLKPGKYTGIGIGPGIGMNRETGNVLKRLIQDMDAPLVIDADAINLLSENKTWLNFLPEGCILTPHIGEFSRLAGKTDDPFLRTKQQTDFAKKYNCYVILKGRFSAIACPDGQLFFNPTGNNGMAKAGSGDVLTGLITGLVAQGLSPMKAALLGTWLHGMAGDLCKEETSAYGMQSGDLIQYIPAAFRMLEA